VKVCIDENLGVDSQGRLSLQPWSVPRLVADEIVNSNDGDGNIVKPLTHPPGKLLMDLKVSWTSDAPIDQQMLIRVQRGPRYWLTSNPNAIQFRDGWRFRINGEPTVPVMTSNINSQCGGAIDIGTNTVAEPSPGRGWFWTDTALEDEWVPRLLGPGETITVWYRCYVWTPPPFSDNANKNSPQHVAKASYARVSLMTFPQQGNLVVG